MAEFDFETLKRRAQASGRQRTKEQEEAIRRRFTAMGGGPSGASIEQQRLAREGQARVTAEQVGQIGMAEAQQAQRQREIQEARGFQSGEAQKQREFIGGESALQRRTAQEEAGLQREFAGTQAGLQREFTGEQAEAQREFAKEQGIREFNMNRELQRLQSDAQIRGIQISQQGAQTLANINARASERLANINNLAESDRLNATIESGEQMARESRDLEKTLAGDQLQFARDEMAFNARTIFMDQIQQAMFTGGLPEVKATALIENLMQRHRQIANPNLIPTTGATTDLAEISQQGSGSQGFTTQA